MNILKRYITKLPLELNNDELDLFSNAGNYLAGDVISRGIIFLTIPVYTRILSPDGIGVLAVFQSIVYMVSIFFSCGTPGAVTRYYYEDRKDFASFLGNNFIFALFFSLIFSIVILLFRRYVADFFRIGTNLFLYICFISITLVGFNIYKSYLQATKQSRKYSILSIGKEAGVFILSIPLILLLDSDKYMGKIFSQSLVVPLLFIFVIYSIAGTAKISFKKQHLKYVFVFGLPVVLHLLSHYLLTSFDQIIINQLLGKTETGLYFVAYKIGLIQNIVNLAIIKAWTPIFYEKLNQGLQKDITGLAQKYALVIFTFAAFLILFSREIITFVTDVKFHSAAPIIPIIILSYLFVFIYTIYVNYIFYHKKTYLISIATLLSGGINIGLNYLLIPKYGYFAAAVTTLISYFILFVFHYVNVRFILKIQNIVPLRQIFKFIIIPLSALAVFALNWIVDISFVYFVALKIITLTFIVFIAYRYINAKA